MFHKRRFEKHSEILVEAPEFLSFNPYHNQSCSNGIDSAALGVGFRPLPQTTPPLPCVTVIHHPRVTVCSDGKKIFVQLA
jgi:hypothetical protein